MTKNNNKKRIKMANTYNEDESDIKRLIIILVGIIIAIILVYFLTRIFVSKDLFNNNNNTPTYNEGSINYNSTLIGAMLNKPEEEYYVMIIDTSASDAVYYTNTISNYTNKPEALRVYLADLDNTLNQTYMDDVNNITSDLTNFRVSGPTLVKIKNKKITESYTTKEKIAGVLKYVEPEDTEE